MRRRRTGPQFPGQPGGREAVFADRAQVLVVSLNTALDRTLLVPGLRLGQVHRITRERTAGGGKGPNVARILAALGVGVRLVGLAGGPTGERAIRDLQSTGLPGTWIPTRGESRTCDILVDPEGPASTVLNGQGPTVTSDEWQALSDAAERLIVESPPAFLVLTGSLPPGVPTDAYARLATSARKQGVPSALDATGRALSLGARDGPTLVKVNADELAEAFAPEAQGAGEGRTDLSALARLPLGLGVEQVVVTDGARGATLFTQDTALRAQVLPGPVVSPIGCGDAFLAGLIAARLGGAPAADQLRLATAAAAGNLAHFGCGIPPGFDVEERAREVEVESLPGTQVR